MESIMFLKPHKNMKPKADALPFSLIESEILPRLSGKCDIGRCRCVCKQWRSFLSTPSFARTHLRSHGTTINDYKLLLLDGQPPLPFRTLPLNNDGGSTTIPSDPNPNPNPNPNPVFILASLDGLVCLGSRESTQLVFWNPFTGAYKKLSPGGPRLNLHSNKAAFNAVGFYTDDSGDYNLVCVVEAGVDGAYIYSHKLDSWRRIDFFFFDSHQVCVWSPATFCGQCVYFTLTVYPLTNVLEWWIMCFDVKTESFRVIQFPPVPDGAMGHCGTFVVLNGCVHMCVLYKMTRWLKQGDLWRLDGGDDTWVKVAAFSDPRDRELHVTGQRICTVSTGDWVVVLDEDKNSFEKVKMEDFTTRYQYFCSPSCEYRSSRMIYVETLVSPNSC